MKNKREDYINEFVDAVRDLKEGYEGTYYWWLNSDDDTPNDWAIVLGWNSGWDGDEDDSCCKDGYRIAAKVAYQPHNSVMQCDYDIDWMMPYDEESSEVDDCEFAIFAGDDTETLRTLASEVLELAESYNLSL